MRPFALCFASTSKGPRVYLLGRHLLAGFRNRKPRSRRAENRISSSCRRAVALSGYTAALPFEPDWQIFGWLEVLDSHRYIRNHKRRLESD
jgi:hypothetical protein